MRWGRVIISLTFQSRRTVKQKAESPDHAGRDGFGGYARAPKPLHMVEKAVVDGEIDIWARRGSSI